MVLVTMTALPGHEREAARELDGGPVAEHAWLAGLLGGTTQAPPEFLFRRYDELGTPRMVILSAKSPVAQRPHWELQVREYATRFAAGTRLGFDLRVSPIVTESRDGKAQRQDVVTREQARLLQARGLGSWADWQSADRPAFSALVNRTCCAWIQGRAARHGIEIHSEGLSAADYRVYGEDINRRQPDARQESGVPFSTVDIRGELTVVDPVTFGFALTRGIGRAKAFGCGLLLLQAAAG